MPESAAQTDLTEIGKRIVVVRGQRVLLDTDLARLYGVTPKRLNEQVRRNRKRFPPDFLLSLEINELRNLRSQFATSSWGGRRYRVLASNEQLAGKLRELEKSLATLDAKTRRQFEEVYATIRALTIQPTPKSRPIGFTASIGRNT